MPRHLRSRELPAWHDPEAVFLLIGAQAATSVWLDAGVDAEQGLSAIVVESGDDDVLIADASASVEAVHERLAAALLGDVVDERGITAEPMLGWFGWLAYEFGVRALGLPIADSSEPHAAFVFATRSIVFDHERGRVRLEWLDDTDAASDASRGAAWADDIAERLRDVPSEPAALVAADTEAPVARWRHDPEQYRALIADCQRSISAGDAYQLCLTNRIDIDRSIDVVETYRRLRRGSPSHHGGFVRFGGFVLLSASPEQFLRIDAAGLMTTRPMKGTRPRADDLVEDARLRDELLASEKERAENLMIVDLMRNDLGRVAELGSVRVTSLHAVEPYAQVHQLVSRVEARLRHPLTVLDVVTATFPAGSMTGAPKESAIRRLAELEGAARGIYSGVFGRIAVDGSVDLAMVIRSIVSTPNGASIGTGGGITALSVPAEEVTETQIKAAPLLAAIGARTGAASSAPWSE